ncbi:helix-turn-helix domain-containing protein [Herbidospora mongoliensis]|uniref:AraC-like ligand-binding domain-containing protein n=1 Tax=Herbidospora mongoliensis TaxID=688067 RepID=UPI0008353BC0|nr:helix-turn-helix domain-containing protein [Herbidospora mongoliensis]
MPYTAHTAGVPAKERQDFWQDVVSTAFVPLEAVFPDKRFEGKLRATTLGALDVIDVDTTAHAARRTPKLVSSAPSDSLKLGLFVKGRARLEQSGRQVMIGAGEMAIYDTDRPYSLDFDQPTRLVVLMFPRTMLGLSQDRVDLLSCTSIPSDTGIGALVAPFLLRLAAQLDEVEVRGGARLAANVVDLIATMLAARLDATPADPDAARRAMLLRITTYIEGHLGDPGLDPAQVAAAHHISTRYLHKLFNAEGTTVAAWIRERRLERCVRDLRDPHQPGRPVSAIGAQWGFPDASHFSRLFKAAYGLSPRDYRNASAEH